MVSSISVLSNVSAAHFRPPILEKLGKENVALMVSGGLDSFIAYYYLQSDYNVYPIFVDLNHAYKQQELAACLKIYGSKLILAPSINLAKFEKPDAEIPLRNLYIAMSGVNLGFNNIAIIAQKDEKSIPDRTKKFYTKTSKLLSYLSGRKISVFTPFYAMDKTDMLEWYLKQVKDIEMLENVFSCYTPISGGRQCGNCPACFRLYTSYKNAGIEPKFKLTDEIKSIYRKKLSSYSKDRQKRILKALQ